QHRGRMLGELVRAELDHGEVRIRRAQKSGQARPVEGDLVTAQGLEVRAPVHEAEIALVGEERPVGALSLRWMGERLEDGRRLAHDTVLLRCGARAPARPIDVVHPVERVPACEGDTGTIHRSAYYTVRPRRRRAEPPSRPTGSA